MTSMRSDEERHQPQTKTIKSHSAVHRGEDTWLKFIHWCRTWVWGICLIIFLFTLRASAQIPILSAERFGGNQLILSWDDSTPFVVEVAPAADGPWFSTIWPRETQSPFICNLQTGPKIDFKFTDNPFDKGGYLFRLKAASVFDVQPESGFVGLLEDTDAFVALLVASEESVAYVCNGDEGISEWFRGGVTDPTEFELTNPAGAKMQAAFSVDTFSGEVTLTTGEIHAFSMTPNHAENAGIFRVIDEQAAEQDVEAGWIVNGAEEERGVLRFRSRFLTAKSIRDVRDGTSNTINLGETTTITKAKVFGFSTNRRSGNKFTFSRRQPTETSPPVKPPAVVDVLFRATAWGPSFVGFIDPTGLRGYSVMNTSDPLPWFNMNRIDIVFDQAVNVQLNSLRLTGVNISNYSMAGFSYNPSTFTASWILSSPIEIDKLRIKIAKESVRATRGDQLMETDYNQVLSVLPGDVNLDRTVLADDSAIVLSKQLTSPGAPNYSIFADVDGSGSILANDAGQVMARQLSTLPAGETP